MTIQQWTSDNRRRSRRKRRKRDPSIVWLLLMLATVFAVGLVLVRRLDMNAPESSHTVLSPKILQTTIPSRNLHRPSHLQDISMHANRAKVTGRTEEKKHNEPQRLDTPKQVLPLDKTLLLGHSHMIPNILVFTHSIDLLSNSSHLQGEDVALRHNVQNTIAMHPGAQVRFLTDSDCIQSLNNVMGLNHPLIDFFRNESKGMFKADICRGAALYETGGLYFDIDLQARFAMWDAIPHEATFVVPLVHRQSKYPGSFFQAFIGVTPRNPIMLRYLELFLKYYQGDLDVVGPLGVILLRQADDEIRTQQGSQTAVYWQEVLYHPELFPDVPPPDWGTRRACRFVVVANRKPPFVVPLYSRVKGSRMCGGKESSK